MFVFQRLPYVSSVSFEPRLSFSPAGMISHLFCVLDNTILVLNKCEKVLAKFIILLETDAQDFNQMEKEETNRLLQIYL